MRSNAYKPKVGRFTPIIRRLGWVWTTYTHTRSTEWVDPRHGHFKNNFNPRHLPVVQQEKKDEP